MSLLAFHENCGVDDLLDLWIGDAAGDLAYDAKGQRHLSFHAVGVVLVAAVNAFELLVQGSDLLLTETDASDAVGGLASKSAFFGAGLLLLHLL